MVYETLPIFIIKVKKIIIEVCDKMIFFFLFLFYTLLH